MRAVSEIEVDVTPTAVFEVLTDATHYPRWLGGARRVVVDDPAWPSPGSEFHHEVGVGPVDVHDRRPSPTSSPDAVSTSSCEPALPRRRRPSGGGAVGGRCAHPDDRASAGTLPSAGAAHHAGGETAQRSLVASVGRLLATGSR
ncbi:MAG: SRPBCC family protein [Ilumatobacteraceae bacterium]